MFWGKVIGFFLGQMMAGPLGAVFGVVIGHFFDRGLKTQFVNGAKIQQIFFDTAFAVMGHIAKADGRVSEIEIKLAQNVMTHLRLSPQQKQQAIAQFNYGKSTAFNLDKALDQLLYYCRWRQDLLMIFVEIELQIAAADGEIKQIEMQLIRHICQRLGFNEQQLQQLLQRYQAERSYQQSHRGGRTNYSTANNLADCYTILGVTPAADKQEIKKAYRRLMSKYHPDKLVSKGLPQEMIEVAKEKTQQVRSAYETICESRGF